jgi:hypothetical protein
MVKGWEKRRGGDWLHVVHYLHLSSSFLVRTYGLKDESPFQSQVQLASCLLPYTCGLSLETHGLDLPNLTGSQSPPECA